MKTATKSFPAHSTATDPLSGQTYTRQYDIFTIGAVWPTASCDAPTGRAHLVDTKSVIWGESGVLGTITSSATSLAATASISSPERVNVAINGEK